MFKGRLGRAAFFLGHIYLVLLFVIPAVIQYILNSVFNDELVGRAVNVVAAILALATVAAFIPLWLSLVVRRWHDMDQTGWMAVLSLIPFLNFLIYLYLQFTPGTKGENTYGKVQRSLAYWVVLGLQKPRPKRARG